MSIVLQNIAFLSGAEAVAVSGPVRRAAGNRQSDASDVLCVDHRDSTRVDGCSQHCFEKDHARPGHAGCCPQQGHRLAFGGERAANDLDYLRHGLRARRGGRHADWPDQLLQVLMGIGVLVKAFAAAVVGGFGSLPGAILGGLLVGVVESIGPGSVQPRARRARQGQCCRLQRYLQGRLRLCAADHCHAGETLRHSRCGDEGEGVSRTDATAGGSVIWSRGIPGCATWAPAPE